jgi:hypothetical protein
MGLTVINLSNLCPLPTAWAPYFMGYNTLYDALQIDRLLMMGLPAVAERGRSEPLMDWL